MGMRIGKRSWLVMLAIAVMVGVVVTIKSISTMEGLTKDTRKDISHMILRRKISMDLQVWGSVRSELDVKTHEYISEVCAFLDIPPPRVVVSPNAVMPHYQDGVMYLPLGYSASNPSDRFTLAHEIYHHYQYIRFVRSGIAPNFFGMNGDLVEGSADGFAMYYIYLKEGEAGLFNARGWRLVPVIEEWGANSYALGPYFFYYFATKGDLNPFNAYNYIMSHFPEIMRYMAQTEPWKSIIMDLCARSAWKEEISKNRGKYIAYFTDEGGNLKVHVNWEKVNKRGLNSPYP